MTEEQIRKIINDTFDKNIMNNLDSAIIFKYIQGLEKENQKYKEAIGNIYSLLNDYEMQNDDVISSYCREIRNVMKGVE